ncbi:unnamed protein product [Chrysoparadoxa australica]
MVLGLQQLVWLLLAAGSSRRAEAARMERDVGELPVGRGRGVGVGGAEEAERGMEVIALQALVEAVPCSCCRAPSKSSCVGFVCLLCSAVQQQLVLVWSWLGWDGKLASSDVEGAMHVVHGLVLVLQLSTREPRRPSCLQSVLRASVYQGNESRNALQCHGAHGAPGCV